MSQDFVRQLPGSGLVSERKQTAGDAVHLDFPMLFLLLGISAYGLLILYSAVGQDTGPVISQSLKILLGIIGMVVIAQISPIFMRRVAPWAFMGGLILLGLLYVFGVEPFTSTPNT